jgi:hypothetical protein
MFPPVTINATSTIEKLSYETRLKYRRQIQRNKLSQERFAEIVTAAVTKAADERERILVKGGADAAALLQGEVRFGFEVLNSMLSSHLSHGADAWMSAQITGIWTAFEALAEEIWIAAVNAHPSGLAELNSGKKPTGESKKIDLFLLQKHGYDLSPHMGTVLSQRYSFDRLEDIRRAYQEAHFEGDQTIDGTISDRSLDALSLTRHVIVHNGGIIDDAFLKRKSDLPAAILGNVGDPLPLTGRIVADLITPVLTLGWNLISAIDEWLVAHAI